jgi:uncharacterized protein (UPF0276 family)
MAHAPAHHQSSFCDSFAGAASFNVLSSLPVGVGLGLKHLHIEAILNTSPPVAFFEIHAENYMVDGGLFHHWLTQIRERYPISMHGVALSIGGEDSLDLAHLNRLKQLIDRYDPAVFSEHLAWSSHGQNFLNDLLPLPYTQQTLRRVCDHIDQVQQVLQRVMLLENPSTYLEFESSTMSEPEFLSEVVRRTGCGLLLDVNNVYVSCVNHHRDPQSYIWQLPLDRVGQVHLAGFDEQSDLNGARLLIDHHGCAVHPDVLVLYAFVLQQTGALPTLIERDNHVPAFDILLEEAVQVEQILGKATHRSAS